MRSMHFAYLNQFCQHKTHKNLKDGTEATGRKFYLTLRCVTTNQGELSRNRD